MNEIGRIPVVLPEWMKRMDGKLDEAWPDKLWGVTPGLKVPCFTDIDGEESDETTQRLYPPEITIAPEMDADEKWWWVVRIVIPNGWVNPDPQNEGASE